MHPKLALATTRRVLRQLSHDKRTLGLLFIIPVVLLGLLAWIYSDNISMFDFVGPPLLGIFPFITMFLVTSITMQRERSGGTLERLLATRIGKLDILLGYAMTFGLLAIVQATVASLAALYLFGLDVTGPIWALLVIALFDALLGAALGLLASAFARSEFQAVQFMPAIVLPQILLCGLLVPIAKLPDILHAVANVLPLTYAIEALQLVASHAKLPGEYYQDIVVVIAFAVAAVILAAMTLRRQTKISCYNSYMSFKTIFSRKYLVRWFIAGGLALLLVSGGVWWCKISVSPERVFWGMIEQSLSTSGVSMSSTMQQGEASLEQHMQYSLGAESRALSNTTLRQGGTVVVTDVLGTLGADYTRYAHIQTERTNASGGPLDLSKILNVWAKTEGAPGTSQLLSQTILGLSLPLGSIPVPIGDLNATQRQKLVNQIRNEDVYKTTFKDAKKETKNGRLHYVYEVKIQAIPYVHLMKEFSKQVGLKDLEQIDPNDYQGEALTVQLTVDARAKRLVEVYIPANDFRQQFSAYDVPVAVQIPVDSVPAEELQKRLSEL